ncbi:MAG TPA: HAD family hydrolase [Terracidiphilus sp.]|jgi:phosphoglycolate phosphatase-like HAD superfamily hydrolase
MTRACKLARSWDEYDAYLFDIDGTLIHCTDAVHYFAFCDVLSSVAGRPLNLDGVTAHGNTDVGILGDALTRAGIPDSQWRPQLQHICDTMCAFVHRRQSELCVTTLPAVEDTLRHLRNKGAVIGLATGNLEEIGKLKLSAARLLDYFHFGGWSDGLETRADVFRRAVQRAKQLASPEAAILVIGDTPSDIRAARANELAVVAVATGIYSFDQLTAEQPDLCIHSLEELAVCA